MPPLRTLAQQWMDRAAQLHGGSFFHAQPILEVIEPAPAAGTQRCAGHDNAWDLGKKLLVQGLADVDRRAGQRNALAALAAHLDPVNVIGQRLGKPLLQDLGHVPAAFGRCGEFHLLLL